MNKIKVQLWEFERDWGSRLDETREFDSKEEAQTFLNEFNAKNTSEHVPDWYMIAKLVK